MGLTAIISSSASSTSAGAAAGVTSLLSPVGAGVGGVFVAAALVLLLASLDLLDASSLEADDLRTTLLATVLPLAIVFAGIVTFRTIKLL